MKTKIGVNPLFYEITENFGESPKSKFSTVPFVTIGHVDSELNAEVVDISIYLDCTLEFGSHLTYSLYMNHDIEMPSMLLRIIEVVSWISTKFQKGSIYCNDAIKNLQKILDNNLRSNSIPATRWNISYEDDFFKSSRHHININSLYKNIIDVYYRYESTSIVCEKSYIDISHIYRKSKYLDFKIFLDGRIVFYQNKVLFKKRSRNKELNDLLVLSMNLRYFYNDKLKHPKYLKSNNSDISKTVNVFISDFPEYRPCIG